MGTGRFNNLPVLFNKAGKVRKVIISMGAVAIKAFKMGLIYSQVVISFPVIPFIPFKLIIITSIIKVQAAAVLYNFRGPFLKSGRLKVKNFKAFNFTGESYYLFLK